LTLLNTQRRGAQKRKKQVEKFRGRLMFVKTIDVENLGALRSAHIELNYSLSPVSHFTGSMGSGKSTLFQTLCLGLQVPHPPSTLPLEDYLKNGDRETGGLAKVRIEVVAHSDKDPLTSVLELGQSRGAKGLQSITQTEGIEALGISSTRLFSRGFVPHQVGSLGWTAFVSNEETRIVARVNDWLTRFFSGKISGRAVKQLPLTAILNGAEVEGFGRGSLSFVGLLLIISAWLTRGNGLILLTEIEPDIGTDYLDVLVRVFKEVEDEARSAGCQALVFWCAGISPEVLLPESHFGITNLDNLG